MRPAGMSSDEDDSDFELDGYYMYISPRKKKKEPKDIIKDPAELGIEELASLDEATKLSMFRKAVDDGNLKGLENLLASGVPLDSSKTREWTPLMTACSLGKADVVKFFLQKGADPNKKVELFTPLMACCTDGRMSEENSLKCMKLLLESGADVNASDRFKETVLITACRKGFETIVTYLLQVPGIEIDKIDRDGWTALFHAVNNNYVSIAKKLLQSGADADILSTYKDMTALDVAYSNNYTEMINLLGGTFNEEPSDEPPPLTMENMLEEFLRELPDSEGNGGFASEVQNIFAGVGLQKLYRKLELNVSLEDFLLERDLAKFGVKLEPVRRKILVRGIHRFFLQPFKRESVPEFKQDKELSLEECINCIANVIKHLVILHATTSYVRIRMAERKKLRKALASEFTSLLYDSYAEVAKTKSILKRILANVKKVKPAGEFPADFICGKTKHGGRSLTRVWIGVGVVAMTAGAVYTYVHISNKT